MLSSLAVLFGGALALSAALARLFRQRPGWLSGSAVAVLATWPLWTLLSGATTCTGGDSDSWATTLALCAILAGLAVPLLIASGETWRPHRAAVPLLTLAPLLLFVDHMAQTGLGTHHLCGPDFDPALAYGDNATLARIFYPAMWIGGLVLTALALLPLARQRPRFTSPDD